MYHCDLNEAAQVSIQAGDILGLELAPDPLSNDAITLSFARVLKGPINYVFSAEQLLPFMVVVLSESYLNQDSVPQITIKVDSGVYLSLENKSVVVVY